MEHSLPTLTGPYRSYQPLAEEQGIAFRESGPWLVYGQPDHDRRWLICLSVCIRHAAEILRLVLPVLRERKVPFILIKDQWEHNRINNHAYPVPLYGKPLIIFTEDVRQARELAARLAALTQAYSGLQLPQCLRLGSIVYAVFSRPNPDYNKENGSGNPQLPFITEVPRGAESEFPEAKHWKEKKLKRIIAGRYLPVSLIASTPKGNILKGVDLKTFNWCFIKQAAAWAAEDINGRQMSDRLRWQKEVSGELKDRVRVPRATDLVEQEGYTYLICEYIKGKSLDELIKTLPDGEGPRSRLITCFIHLLPQVEAMHQAGFVHRDLTAKNVLVTPAGAIYLSDFELSYDLKKEKTVPFDSGTFGYMSPQQVKGQQPECADDVYSLGALLYYIVSRKHPEQLTALPAEERREAIDALNAPPAVKEAIRQCLQDDPEARPIVQQLSDMLSGLITPAFRQKTRRKFLLKKRLQRSLGLIVLAALTVLCLWLFSYEPNSRDNGFNRRFTGSELRPAESFPLPADTRMMAGFNGNRLYFSTTRPWTVLVLDLHTSRFNWISMINDAGLRNKLSTSAILQADSSGLTLFDGAAKVIVINNSQGKTLSVHPVPLPFTRALRFSGRSVALRVFNLADRDQALSRYDLRKDTLVNQNQVTEVKRDFGLATSGFLDYDPASQHLVYVTRYANHILLMDTLMQVINRSNTIDTLSSYTLQSGTETGSNGGVITNASPRQYVNRAAMANEGRLYVWSAVKADNEPHDLFMSGPVIDVYGIPRLDYQGSFRLADVPPGLSLRGFRVRSGKLYALYPGILKVYLLKKFKNR